MTKITISYRRVDTGAITGRIFDRLKARYGEKFVFLDIIKIPPGSDYRKYINEELENTDILLVIVGPKWTGKASKRIARIQWKTDQVRIEVETALRRDIPVVPVLVGNASMPEEYELPDGMREFAYRNAVKVDALEDFEDHVKRLIRSLDRLLKTRPSLLSPANDAHTGGKHMARHPQHRRSRVAPVGATPSTDNTDPTPIGHPVFAQPQPTPNPTQFRIKHASDAAAYKTIDQLNAEHKLAPLPFPMPRGLPEPILSLAQVLGAGGADIVKNVATSGQLVFHSVGDTGSVHGPRDQELVADKMHADFDEEAPSNVPQFFFHLGDVVYNFGEARYYYDQFYEPYREYPAPIIALAGNHDGMPAPGTSTPTLAAFLENFCATDFEVTPEAGGLSRTAQIQPGVFFTFEAPFLRIIALYSNTLEDPGVIASPEIGNAQLDFLKVALARAKGFSGALIIAHHHPAYTVGSKHSWSEDMRAQIDKVCADMGVWPHAVLSAHAHNYQRFTRVHQSMEIPYIIAGNGGHAVSHLKREVEAGGAPLAPANTDKTAGSRYTTPFRAPTVIQKAGQGQDLVRLESYDDQDFGYLRIVVTDKQLRIEYHPATDGDAAKTPDDMVAVDLSSRKLVAPTV